ncbi:A/G-specific adenine glycosylase [Gloeobacter kilaueensis]|uniref:Adenine DNA glycosylase n=1 Tax=Gloeobacter kilaueensis (strain ATCC BAA-2537 / CCAP 1431/1 / ULC 316 / JS1) TaxID=1183438 RepID=U5QM45_GLOK1|nr:A/G-specific adenine glycosylase [Gloeobacter kilaueensis]AGY58684.1 A/G-specific adenine glycosylase [Gloeobacter kilaueensis JS1]
MMEQSKVWRNDFSVVLLDEQMRRLRRQLLAWYGQSGRDLPWRKTRDPYAIWVSEIMLQQTQVKTVLPYYERWLTTLPTIASLARAEPGAVLKLWEGLGYYARAHNLQKAAQQIQAQHGGSFPRTLAQVQALPGIGRSTAAAILSSAFDQCEAILDANVRRVLSRLFAVADPHRQAEAKLWHFSATLIDPDFPRDFNQALMDLGATVCLPRTPRCLLCPWQADCAGRHTGDPARLPVRATRTERRILRTISVPIEHQGQYWLLQRPEGGLLAGLWEFPLLDWPAGAEPEALIRSIFGERLQLLDSPGRVEHEFTHRILNALVLRARWIDPPTLPEMFAHRPQIWALPEQWPSYPMPGYVRKICRLLQ